MHAYDPFSLDGRVCPWLLAAFIACIQLDQKLVQNYRKGGTKRKRGREISCSGFYCHN